MTAGSEKSSSTVAKASTLDALLRSAVDAILTIDENGMIASANPAAERIFQYSLDELIDHNIKMLMPEPYQSEHDGYLEHYRDTGQRQIIGLGREVIGRRKDGSTFPLHLSVSEFSADGERFFAGIIHDLSARKDAERALHRAQKMESIGQLTGGVAHDFNNLLTVIVGNLELLDMNLEDESQREFVREAQEAADLGAKLTERLLAFARRTPLEPAIVNLNELILGLTDLLHRTLGETIDLSTVLSTELWMTRTDPGQIEAAIVNLAVNARDAMPRGGKLIVETRNTAIDEAYVAAETGLNPGDYVQLSVSDTGLGMPEDIRERVFEPFFTTKEIGHGTGLGLSMVYGFAKQSGGHITVYSEIGMGTTINLYLPRFDSDSDSSVQSEIEVEARPSAGELILVVEDDPRVRRLALIRLAELGYKTLEAANGPDALAILDGNSRIDLVFTDLIMPGGMSGYDLCEEISKRYPIIRVLLTSGYAEELVHGEKLTKENLKVLRKPYRQSDLARSIAGALANN